MSWLEKVIGKMPDPFIAPRGDFARVFVARFLQSMRSAGLRQVKTRSKLALWSVLKWEYSEMRFLRADLCSVLQTVFRVDVDSVEALRLVNTFLSTEKVLVTEMRVLSRVTW